MRRARSENEVVLGIQGFTLIEILMVVLLLSILAAIGISQFKDFSLETRNAATKANLQILRNGISHQYGQSRIRCAQTGTSWPPKGSLIANDVTTVGTYGGETALCTTTEVANPSDRRFANGNIPVNPWGGSTGGPSNTIYDCVVDGGGSAPQGGACSPTNALDCNGAGSLSSTSDGWCYNVSTGQLWPNSARNDGKNSNTGNEYLY